MEHAVTLLLGLGWRRQTADYDPAKLPGVLLANGQWKCVVGPLWTTFWKAEEPGRITVMRSVKTDRDDEVKGLGDIPRPKVRK